MHGEVDPERLWLTADQPRTGRRPRHSRAEITAEAVALADAEGLAAVTMRAVAARLGVGTMSLYTYVPDKDTLLELMIDQAGGDLALPPVTGDWRADLHALARAQRTLMHRHPWLPAAYPLRRTIGPGTLAALEHALAALAPTGLPGAARLEVFALLTGFVASHVGYEVAQREALERSTRSAADLGAAQLRYLTAMAASGRYPQLAATLAEPPAPADPEATFERLLGRLINGLSP
ncbi:AcrR family transcriptional regulator [Kitasatospora gansuensis]|uniref:AcrR family transcriptional regulator n=1 Tax=Kitasatospora gansuensis TaxID=258050 RepID=A0A7W7SHU3_9ACTN|nr:AcrR family transcriptional regulator [Kitasatospora gansuensis]